MTLRGALEPSGTRALPNKVTEVPKDVIKHFPHSKRVGNYLLGRTLGEGSFAKVKEALHVLTGETVAVKVIDKKKAKDDAYVRKHMRREGKLLQIVRHSHVIQLYEIMETENSYYLVSELCQGGDLMDHICSKKRLPETEVRKFIRQVISAVDYIHKAGILHRDLKVENLLLDENQDIKIIDFGLSNAIRVSPTSPGCVVQEFCSTQCGSPAYAAPELLGNKKYDTKVDIWSIGVNMFAMLTGSLPFTVEPFNIKALYNKMIGGDMNAIPSDVTNDCKDFLHKLLTADPDDRITLQDAMNHPWITEGSSKPMTSAPFPNRVAADELDYDVIRHMSCQLDYRISEIIRLVTNNTPSNATATYYLFYRRHCRYNADNPATNKMQSSHVILSSISNSTQNTSGYLSRSDVNEMTTLVPAPRHNDTSVRTSRYEDSKNKHNQPTNAMSIRPKKFQGRSPDRGKGHQPLLIHRERKHRCIRYLVDPIAEQEASVTPLLPERALRAADAGADVLAEGRPSLLIPTGVGPPGCRPGVAVRDPEAVSPGTRDRATDPEHATNPERTEGLMTQAASAGSAPAPTRKPDVLGAGGRDGGRDGADGRDGAVGRDGGRDGADGRDGGRDGADGRDVAGGRHAADGRDGVGGRDGVSGRDDGRDGADPDQDHPVSVSCGAGSPSRLNRVTRGRLTGAGHSFLTRHYPSPSKPSRRDREPALAKPTCPDRDPAGGHVAIDTDLYRGRRAPDVFQGRKFNASSSNKPSPPKKGTLPCRGPAYPSKERGCRAEDQVHNTGLTTPSAPLAPFTARPHKNPTEPAIPWQTWRSGGKDRGGATYGRAQHDLKRPLTPRTHVVNETHHPNILKAKYDGSVVRAIGTGSRPITGLPIHTRPVGIVKPTIVTGSKHGAHQSSPVNKPPQCSLDISVDLKSCLPVPAVGSTTPGGGARWCQPPLTVTGTQAAVDARMGPVVTPDLACGEPRVAALPAISPRVPLVKHPHRDRDLRQRTTDSDMITAKRGE